MKDASDDSFDGDVVRAPGATIVDFWAPWCKPCEVIEPVLAELATAHDAELVRLNIDEHVGVASRYGVLSLPTVMLFRDGEPRATIVGARRRAHYEREFGPHF